MPTSHTPRLASLWDEKYTPFAICAHSLYRRRTGSSAGVTRRGTRCQQTQTPANKHFTSTLTLTTSRFAQPPPPRLPPMVTRFVFLPLRPPLSGLDGHHCRGEVAFIHGHDRRPSPGKGVGRRDGEREQTHIIRLYKLAGTGHLASFSMRPVRLSTRATSATFHVKYKQKWGSIAELRGWGIRTFPGAHVSSSSPQQEQAARRQQPESLSLSLPPSLPLSHTNTNTH